MNWKITVGGLMAMVALLGTMAAADVVWGYTGGTIRVIVPTAILQGVEMYGDTYQNDGSSKNVVTQEVENLICPLGQIIERRIEGTNLTVVVKFENATLRDVLMKAENLLSRSGTLTGVTMRVKSGSMGLQQNISGGTMQNLSAEIYYAYIGSLSYDDLSIYFRSS